MTRCSQSGDMLSARMTRATQSSMLLAFASKNLWNAANYKEEEVDGKKAF